MPVATHEWRQDRHKLILACRALLDKADTEKRPLSPEERANYDKAWSDAEAMRTRIEDQERRNDLEREEIAAKNSQEAEKRQTETKTETAVVYNERRASPEYRTAFNKVMFGEERSLTVEERALVAGEQVKGGYLYAPEQFVAELIQNVTDATMIRGISRQFSVPNADAMSAPVIANRMAAAAWTSELGNPSTDSTLDFGKKRWTPHPLAKEILVSNTLLQKASQAEGIVRSELGRIVAEANENGFLTGTGVQSPLGLFVASDDGISTDRDVSTSNSSTSPTVDGLKNAKFTLKQAYWANARWVMNKECGLKIALLKDGNGRYLWQDSIVQGEPDRLLNFPVVFSEFAPHVFTASQYVAILGDFSQYWIVDALDMTIARATELYIRSNQTWFGVRMATDGGPAKEEAFVRVKLGT